MSSTFDTPLMKQYASIREQYPGIILFFRLGDFYEMFDEQAREVSAILNLTLTQRHGVPMCGIPFHAAATYIGRLLKAGKKIGICEQISSGDGKNKLFERKVISTYKSVNHSYNNRHNNCICCRPLHCHHIF